MLRSSVAWLGILAVMLFLVANVKTTDAGVGYLYLVIAVTCLAAIIFTNSNFINSIYLRRSALFLLAFLTYFLLKLLIDIPELSEVKALTVGTSGGLVFALFLGVVLSILVNTTFHLPSKGLSYDLTMLAFLILCLLLVFDTYRSHIQFVRDDLFLISSENRRYQRPGNFVIMAALIVSVLVTQINVEKRRRSILQGIVYFSSTAVYLLILGLLLVTSQLIGSNAGFIVTFLIGGATFVWITRQNSGHLEWAQLISGKMTSVFYLFRRLLPGMLRRAFLLSVLFVLFTAVVFSYMNLETQQFRIFGFSQGRLGGNSISSRMRVLSSNFMTQFAYNPLFGNLKVDQITTGDGSYAHSLVSILSHLGIVGGLLFATYVSAVVKDLRYTSRSNRDYFDNSEVGVLRLIYLAVIFVIASVATFFTWMPLWFAVGFLSPPLVLRKESRVTP